MAKPTPSQDASAPPQDFPQVPPRDLHPTSDIRFVMHEMGSLATKVDRLIADVNKQGDKVSALDKTVSDAFLVGKVLAAVLVALGGVLFWLATILWPLRDQLLKVLAGS